MCVRNCGTDKHTFRRDRAYAGTDQPRDTSITRARELGVARRSRRRATGSRIACTGDVSYRRDRACGTAVLPRYSLYTSPGSRTTGIVDVSEAPLFGGWAEFLSPSEHTGSRADTCDRRGVLTDSSP